MPRILILGGGFGGVAVAQALESSLGSRDIEIMLVSRENYSLYTPMLHSVASGEIAPPCIANPLRNLVSRVTTLQANVEAVDLEARRVDVSHTAELRRRSLTYDYLVLAIGSESNFFGLPGVAERACTFRTLGDAVLLRNRIVTILEAASVEEDAAQRAALLTFVVAGGGFAGVEALGAMTDLVTDCLPYYPRIETSSPRFILVQGGNGILPELGEKLGTFAESQMKKRGVEIRLNTRVTAATGDTVVCDKGEPISARTLVWATGVAPNRLFRQVKLPTEKGRIVVDATLRVQGFQCIWAVGDCASVPDPATGQPCPPTAQHAIRQGAIAGHNIAALILGVQPKPFRYKMLGQLAAIGHHSGVARILGVRFSGFFALLLWRAVYLMKLPRLSKKAHVLVSWFMNLFFSRDLVQLVTVQDVEAMAKQMKQSRLDVLEDGAYRTTDTSISKQ